MIEKVQTRPAGYPRPPTRIASNLIPRNLPLSMTVSAYRNVDCEWEVHFLSAIEGVNLS
jgi:hypothetical protein